MKRFTFVTTILTLCTIFLVSALMGADIDLSKQQSRKWVAVTGQSIEGKLVKLEEEIVHLELADGKTAKVKLGQLSSNDQQHVLAAVSGQSVESLASNNKVVAVRMCGDSDYVLFAKKDGTLWGMGSNRRGMLGIPERQNEKILLPRLIATNVSVKRLYEDTSYYHREYFITTDGTLWKLGTPPRKIADNVKQVSYDFMLTADGQLLCWDSDNAKINTKISPRSNVGCISDEWCSFYLNNNGMLMEYTYKEADRLIPNSEGTVKFWRADDRGKCFFLKQDKSLWWTNGGEYAKALFIAHNVVYGKDLTFLTTDGNLFYVSDITKPGYKNQGSSKLNKIADNVASFFTGSSNKIIFYITKDGTLWMSSIDGKGVRRFSKDRSEVTSPRRLASDVASAKCFGSDQLFFIKNDGSLWVMGWFLNTFEKAFGEYVDTPHKIADDVAVLSNTVGNSSANSIFFVKKDGTFWGMGHNNHGELGDGTTTHRTVPVQVKVPTTPLSALKR
jgi:hypothetical protein